MAVELLRYRFTVEEYHRMAEAGILGEDDRVELLEGEIVEMSPIGSRHAACVNRCTRHFSARSAGFATVSVQNPVTLPPRSEPQPDLALLRPRDDDYVDALPEPDDVLLLVEVADTTAGVDRRYKVPLYAAAGIAEVWLIDLNLDVIEVHRQPAGRTYTKTEHAGRGDRIAPLALPEVVFEVTDLLP